MKTRCLLGMTLLLGLSVLTACGGSEPVAVNPQPQPQAQPEATASATPAEQFVSGQLLEIDADAKTLVLKDIKGTEQRFSFTPATKITGIPNPAEFSRQEGRNATIRYVERENLKSAVIIHVEIGS